MSSVGEALASYFDDNIKDVTNSKLQSLIGLIDDDVRKQLIQRKKDYLKEKKSKESNMENFVNTRLPELIDILRRRICEYHSLYSLPLIAELWEETLHRSIEELEFTTTWTPTRGHGVGEDMRINGLDHSRISCKSGQILNTRALHTMCVKFNGGRSTSHHTLEERIAHFSGDHDDYYFLLAKPKIFRKQYNLLVFRSELVRPNQLEWTQIGNNARGVGPFICTITENMSYQLWTTLPMNLITHNIGIDCNEN
jgi:hypothetical protein